MRNLSLRLLLCLILLTLAHLSLPSGASAQGQIAYPPYEWYVFHMGNASSTNGYYHTPWYSQGANVSGWTFLQEMAAIYPEPGNGYTPAPETGLVPLHQWTVFQGVRSYIYYSTTYTSHGSGYTYNNVAGYVYPVSMTQDINGHDTLAVGQWYSQDRGFYYSIAAPGATQSALPPNPGYTFQGFVFRLPGTPTAATKPGRCLPFGGPVNCNGTNAMPYNAPPAQDPSCDPWQEQDCYNSGGSWDSGSCYCYYY